MILIGQYDSPFVRRVAIALTIYGLSYEHRPWSVFSDADKVRAFNPLVRVPTLVLDDGLALLDSASILDHLDGLVGPERALLPKEGRQRSEALRIVALATGLSDLAVSLFYETKLHETASDYLVARRRSQIGGALGALEADLAGRPGPYWFGERISHADIAAVAMLRHLVEAHPGIAAPADFPAVFAHAARLEAEPVFALISQPFIPPS